MESVSIYDFRKNLAEYINRAQAGECFRVTRYGHAIALLAGLNGGKADRGEVAADTAVEDVIAAYVDEVPAHREAVRPFYWLELSSEVGGR